MLDEFIGFIYYFKINRFIVRNNGLRMRLLCCVRTTVGNMALREKNGIESDNNNDDVDDETE